MLHQSEQKILNLIKLGPIFIIFISIIMIFIIVNNNNQNMELQIKKAEKESILEKKAIIKREVERVYNYIEDELKNAKIKIQDDIKSRVNEAISIANSIYQNNQDKESKIVQKLIFDALRDIRFNNSRGYFFVYTLNGTNVMHPILKELEGKNLWDFKDKKESYVIRTINKIIKKDKEGFLTWWWSKPNDKENDYEKIGFVKEFKPYNWFIGTGEYVHDYEETLKKELLNRIQNIRFGKNGYIFIIDKEGTFLSHIKKSNVGLNRINLQDKNGFKITKEILRTSKKGEGYISYIGTIKPTTGLPSEKISFIKGFEKWKWAIGAGVYISEIDKTLEEKKNIIIKSNKSEFNQIIFISFFIFICLFFASAYFAKITKYKFVEYKNKTKEKALELANLNTNLEKKVHDRTSELEKINEKLKRTIDDLTKTKADLISSQKMATLGELVSSITHEINTPLGIGITSISHIQEITKKIEKQYKDDNMTEDDFESYLNDLNDLSKIISINLNNTVKLVKSFKDIAVDQALEDKREFNLFIYLEEIILAFKNKTKKAKIKVELECEKGIIINSYPHYIFQIITNLINNSILHGFQEIENGSIKINVNNFDDFIEIIYEDNGTGISENLEKNVFNKYFTTKKGTGGTGLGLYIIKKIVNEKLKGEINVNTKIEKGVQFLIKIPKIVDNYTSKVTSI